jgi:hypothetical protein
VVAWSDPPLDRLKRRESWLQIRGNPKIKFARKPHFRPQKPANTITSSRSISQLAQWFRKTSQATIERGAQANAAAE